MTVLRCEKRHVDQLVPLFDAYRQFYRQPSDVRAVRTFLEARVAGNESVIFAALEPDDRFVGFTQLYPTFSSVSLRPAWILNDLFVIPDMRGKSVGRALLERARDWAKQTGTKGLALETEASNSGAQKLYESFGFHRNANFFYELEV